MHNPIASLNLRSEYSTTNFITLLTSCFPVQSLFGFSMAGLTRKSLVLAGLFSRRENVDW